RAEAGRGAGRLLRRAGSAEVRRGDPRGGRTRRKWPSEVGRKWPCGEATCGGDTRVMLIHPWDASSGSEWREWLSAHDFGQLIAGGRGRDLPVVTPAHFA